MQDWIVPGVAGVLALVALALVAALLRARSRTDRALSDARTETAALRAQLEAVEQRLARPAAGREPVEAEFVITDLGEDGPRQPAGPHPEIGTALFADLVLRETVVKAASIAYGVRRALDPATRNRIRFEMRREVRSSRKRRLREGKRLLRQARAAERARLDEGSAA